MIVGDLWGRVSDECYRRWYPDQSHDGTRFFYEWLRKETAGSSTLLNLGAGCGDLQEEENFHRRSLQGPERTVYGCDPDPIVLKNMQVDAAQVMLSPQTLPYEDSFFEVVYSDYVLEHVASPTSFLKEVYRVLKPGGCFFFRTPNLWHYVSITACILPHWVHDRVANKVRCLPEGAHEPYPTYYRMNTRRRLGRLLRNSGFLDPQFHMFEGEPSYMVFSGVLFLLGVAYERAVNATACLKGFRANIFGKAARPE